MFAIFFPPVSPSNFIVISGLWYVDKPASIILLHDQLFRRIELG